MKKLQSLVQFIGQNTPKRDLRVLENILTKDELLLFKGIQIANYQTDIIAAQEIFGIKSNTPKYQKIKKGLTDRLYDAILFTTPSLKGAHKQMDELVDINKTGSILSILGFLQRRDLSLPLIEEKFAKAYKYFMHNEVLSMAHTMRLYYGLTEPNISRYQYYHQIFADTIQYLNLELKASLYYESINIRFGKIKKVNKAEMAIEITGYLEELAPFEGRVRSLKFHRDYYSLKMVYHHIQNHYAEVVQVCDQLLHYLDSLDFVSQVIRRFAVRQKAEHLLLMGDNDNALIEVNRIVSLEVEGTTPWLNSNKMLLLVLLNKKDYSQANLIHEKLSVSNVYKNIKSVFKRQIALIGVYLYLFKLMDMIPGSSVDTKSEIKKYLNEYPEYTRDKAAMNIPIIIAQLLEAIVLKKESDVFDRMEALKKYSSRYITKSDSIRSNCFINMLLEVVRNNYHVVAIERHAKKYYTKLVANPKISSEEAAEVELIPYEELWQIIMNYLGSRRMQEGHRR